MTSISYTQYLFAGGGSENTGNITGDCSISYISIDLVMTLPTNWQDCPIQEIQLGSFGVL